MEPLDVAKPSEQLLSFFLLVIPVLLVVLLVRWWRTAKFPARPDPWETEPGHVPLDENAVPVCHRCLRQQAPDAWFCPECGTAVGPYNNLMPYLNVFSQGEVLRSGTLDRHRANGLEKVGFILIGMSFFVFWFTPLIMLLPVYLYFVFRNLRRYRQEPMSE